MDSRAILLLILFAALSLGGCRSRPPERIHIPDAAPIIAAARFTETTVMGEVADVRLQLAAAVKASAGLPSESAVIAAAAQVETSLAAVESALAASPAADIEKILAEFQTAVDQLRAVIAERDAEIQRLRSAEGRFWNRVLIGLAIACTLGAVASGFFSASIPVIGPYLGPRIGVLLGACAATCYTIAYVAAWTREHPVKTAVAVVALLSTAAGLAWANRVQHRAPLPSAASPATA